MYLDSIRLVKPIVALMALAGLCGAAQVLLLRTNGINAQFLPDMIAMFRSNGWTIISPQQAYQDPLYRATPKVLPAGESIPWSVAKQAQLSNLRYPAEDDVYEKPILDRLGL